MSSVKKSRETVRMKQILLFLFAAAAFLIGCAYDEVPYRGIFVNKSSLTLTVSPNGQDWEPFTLPPGQQHSVTLHQPTVLFVVDPPSVVWLFDETTSTITFFDRDPDPDDDTLYYCVDGTTACDGVTAILYCNGGFWKRRLCADACADLGYTMAIGCGYSSNAGKDQCFCE